MHEATLKQRESKLGPDHPDTLTSRNNLAAAYQAAGRTDDAIKMHEATLKLFESKLGPDHPDTLEQPQQPRRGLPRRRPHRRRHQDARGEPSSNGSRSSAPTTPTRSSAATTSPGLPAAGRTDEAIKMHEATLKQRESKLGPDHPDTLVSRNNLAAAYRCRRPHRRRHQDARGDPQATGVEARPRPPRHARQPQQPRRGLPHRRPHRRGHQDARGDPQATGVEARPDHPDTLISRNNLAVAYHDAGRTDDAIKMFEATLKQLESKLGPDHPSTLTSRNNLASAYSAPAAPPRPSRCTRRPSRSGVEVRP